MAHTHHTHEDQTANEAIRYGLRLYRVQKHELAHSVKFLRHCLDLSMNHSARSLPMETTYDGVQVLDDLTSVEKKVLLVAVKYMRDCQDRSMPQMMA